MNSNGRKIALALCALTSAACVSRTSPTPPTFQAGGLLALSTPVPNPYLLQDALEGVYDTTSRFGSPVVVHASQWGDLAGDRVTTAGQAPITRVNASVSILAADHYAFAILQAGCLPPSASPVVSPATTQTQLVLEGYWRYLDTNNPDPTTTGLVRLFVQPQSVADYVCGAPAWDATQPIPAHAPLNIPVTLAGATGNGENLPGDPLTVTWVQPRKSRLPPCAQPPNPTCSAVPSFLVGVHHGGCQTTDNCGISENTPETSILATQLGGEYLEVDTRLTKDNVPVFFHLSLNPGVVQGVYCTGQVEDYTYEQLTADCRLRNGEVIPRVVDMIGYILARTKLPLYLDSKTSSVILPVANILAALDGERPPNLTDPTNDGYVRCNPPPNPLPAGFTPATWPPAGKRCLFPGSNTVSVRGVIGLPDSDSVNTYQSEQQSGQINSTYQRCLVEENSSDVTSLGCVAWMPRYTRGPMQSEVNSLQSTGHFVGFWTINDPATIDAFLTTNGPNQGPNGMLTNYLGLLNQRYEVVGTPPQYPPTLAGSP